MSFRGASFTPALLTKSTSNMATRSIAGPVYEFRHSTSDMTSAGYSTGICQSGTTTCASPDRVTASNDGSTDFLRYISSSLPPPGMSPLYWAVRPTMPVSGSSGNGQSPIWINTDYNPNMAAGDHIAVAGLTGNTAANPVTNVPITGVFPRTTWFHTNPSPSWPTGATSGQLTSIICNGSSCTVNLTASHGIVPGWRVLVYSSLTGDATHGYRYTVTATPTSSSFTFASTAAAGTYASDTAGQYHMAVQAEPRLSIARAPGSGNWAGETGATLVSTENFKNFAQIAFSPRWTASRPVRRRLKHTDTNAQVLSTSSMPGHSSDFYRVPHANNARVQIFSDGCMFDADRRIRTRRCSQAPGSADRANSLVNGAVSTGSTDDQQVQFIAGTLTGNRAL